MSPERNGGTEDRTHGQGEGKERRMPDKANTRTYKVQGMRVLLPTDKTREKNPDLAFTVTGKFFAEDGTPLTIPQKAITTDMLPLVAVNIEKGTLTLPAGQRGAPKREGASQADVDALLASAKTTK